MLDNFSKALSGIFVGALVARMLGPEMFGYYSMCMIVIGLAYPFITFGSDAVIFKYLVTNTSAILNSMNRIALLRFLLAVGITLVVFLSLDSTALSVNKTIIILLGLSLVLDTQCLFKEYFVARRKSKLLSISSIVSTWIGALAKIAVVTVSPSIIALLSAVILQKVTFIILGFLAYTRAILPQTDSSGTYGIKKCLKMSYPFIFTSVSGTLLIYTDQMVISFFLGVEQMGIYSVASKIIISLYAIPTILSNTLFPDLAELKAKLGYEEFNSRMGQTYRKCHLMSVILIVPFCFFSNKFIDILYGENYVAAGPVMAILSFTLFFVMMNVNNTKLILLNNDSNAILIFSVLGIIANFVMNIFFVPAFGIQGGAIATLLSLGLMCFAPFFLSRTRFIFYIQYLSLQLKANKVHLT